jgi:hypothetical protein
MSVLYTLSKSVQLNSERMNAYSIRKLFVVGAVQ